MPENEIKLSNNLLNGALFFTTLVLLITYFNIKGYISPRLFALLLLAVMGFFFHLTMKRLRRNRTAQHDLPPSVNTNPSAVALLRIRTAVMILPILLVFGWLVTSGQPLIPRLVGAGINVFITSWFAFLLFRAKRNLR